MCRQPPCSDLQEVWGRSIEKELGVAPCDLHLYQAVLVIPTLGRRAAVKHLVSLLLLGLGAHTTDTLHTLCDT